jgi:hypothetical protein
MNEARCNLIEARRLAIKAVKLRLKRQGIKAGEITHRDLIVLANEYLVRHHDEIIEQAAANVRAMMAEEERKRQLGRVQRTPRNRTLPKHKQR